MAILIAQVLGWAWTVVGALLLVTAAVSGDTLSAAVLAVSAALTCPLLCGAGRPLSAVRLTGGIRGLTALVLLFVGLSLASPDRQNGASGSEHSDGAQVAPERRDEAWYRARIEPSAVTYYSDADRRSYPKLFAKLGSRTSEIGSVGEKAARMALDSGKCDKVVMANVGQDSNRDNIAIFVDCANETRLRITEADINAGQTGDVETKGERYQRVGQQWVQDDSYIRQAKERVRESLKDPSSAEFRNVFVSRKDGIAICGEVNARNGFGGKVGYQLFIVSEVAGVILPDNNLSLPAQWQRFCSLT